jgi:4-diphosphocytidyl-2C-methyl-D-erythritol kinase
MGCFKVLVAAETVEPDLVECRTALRPLAERTVHLTGSGSTLFIPADNTMHAEALATAIEDRLGLKARVVSAVGLPQVETDCS